MKSVPYQYVESKTALQDKKVIVNVKSGQEQVRVSL